MNSSNMNNLRFLKSLGIALMLGVIALGARAGDGHDHGDAPPAASGPALPRFAAVSDLFELVGVLDGKRLTLYLDHAADNRPVKDAKLELVNLVSVDAKAAFFGGASLAGAKLAKANLRYATFTKADLSRASGAGAILSDAILVETRATEASFLGARLSHADLSHADLSRADLRDADLGGANLHDVRDDGATWTGANLASTKRTDRARLEAEHFHIPGT